MGKRTTNIKLKKKLNRIRNQKNCIPQKIKANEWDPNNDGITAYREFRPEVKHIPIIERKGIDNKKPWYYLTKEEHIAIENKRHSTKMSNKEYIINNLKRKVKKWDQTHEQPILDTSKTYDKYYIEEHPKWRSSRKEYVEKEIEKIAKKKAITINNPNHKHLIKCKNCWDYKNCFNEYLSIFGYENGKDPYFKKENLNSHTKKAA